MYDPSKFVIVSESEAADGPWLADILRKNYHLEPEMSTDRYVILMSSPADTKEGFERMVHALGGIDRMLERQAASVCATECEAVPGSIAERKSVSVRMTEAETVRAMLPDRAPKAVMKSSEAAASQGSPVPLSRSAGRVCRDFIYIYPPGIPLLVPGEQIEESHLELIRTWQKHHLEVHGIRRVGDFVYLTTVAI